jgi:SOS-response transcriptional repressor LexA
MYSDIEPVNSSEETNIGVSVHAGFPNAAEDNRGRALDFNALLVRHPSSTYCFRIEGKSHEDQGIFNGDIAVIDRALTPQPQDLVLYFVDENFVITKYRSLRPRTEIWGVVTATIHNTRGTRL